MSKMMNIKNLRDFLVKANLEGYASGENSREVKEADGSTTIIYTLGIWKFHDNFFGGEPFGGREVVFYKEKPVWMMVYYGLVKSEITEFGDIYKFLRESLKHAPLELPVRGPKSISQGDFSYQNSWDGDLEEFKGEEKIFQKGEEIFHTTYAGGLINQR